MFVCFSMFVVVCNTLNSFANFFSGGISNYANETLNFTTKFERTKLCEIARSFNLNKFEFSFGDRRKGLV